MSLKAEVQKFKMWAEVYSLETRSAEWECAYNGWEGLHSEAITFLASVSPDQWCAADVDDLLYAIARDNEVEYLIQQVANSPETFLQLAMLSLKSSESDAKWQFAAQLSNLHKDKTRAEAILLQLVDDKNEYVTRRALLALGDLRSDNAEAQAEKAWNTGLEYQRIAALWVFAKISSTKLDSYIERAIEDGRKYLVENALQVRRQPDNVK